MSGQGPYFGQKAWFTYLHPEKNIQSAIDRYANEIKRVHGVIDRHLRKTGTQYLVGYKCTYADLAFTAWDMVLPFVYPEYKPAEEWPDFYAWHQRLMERPAVKKIVEEKRKLSEKK